MVVLLFCSVSRTHSYSYSRRRHSFTILHLYSLLYLIHSPHPSVCWCCLLCNAAKVLSLSSLKQIHLSHILHIVCVCFTSFNCSVCSHFIFIHLLLSIQCSLPFIFFGITKTQPVPSRDGMCVCVSWGGMGVGVYDVHKCVLTHMVRRIFYKYIIQCVSVFGVEFSLLLQFFFFFSNSMFSVFS